MKAYTRPELVVISRIQKHVLRLILVSLLVVLPLIVPLPPGLDEALTLAALPALLLIGAIGAVLVYRLAKAIRCAAPWVYVAFAFIPYINTVTLLILNARATAALRANGVEVGLMGAKQPLDDQATRDSVP